MINVKDIYDQVEALSGAQAAAYSDPVQFNLQSKQVEEILFGFFLDTLGENRSVEALEPFFVRSELKPMANPIVLPSDFKAMGGLFLQMHVDGELVNVVPSKTTPHRISQTFGAAIRGFNPKRRATSYYISGNKVIIDSQDQITYYRLLYYRTPVYGVYGYTTNSSAFVTNYDSAASVNYEWDARFMGKIIDLFLYLRGLQIKDTELINYLNSKQQ